MSTIGSVIIMHILYVLTALKVNIIRVVTFLIITLFERNIY